QGHRSHPGAGEREGARGRVHRGRTHRPRAPDAVGGRAGGGARGGRLGHPRVIPPRPRFLFDLASPECWLAAERVNTLLPEPPEWVPVLAPPAPVARGQVERRAAERGLLEVRWPAVVPADSRDALLAATFAKGSGRSV